MNYSVTLFDPQWTIILITFSTIIFKEFMQRRVLNVFKKKNKFYRQHVLFTVLNDLNHYKEVLPSY